MNAAQSPFEADQVIAPGIPTDAASARSQIDALSLALAQEALTAKALVGQLKGNKAFIGQASRDYSGRFLFELLQNAYDSHPRGTVGEVRILLDETAGAHGILYVANSGKPFDGNDVRAISEIAQSSKEPGEGIGNKGVGFKSVLEVCQWPEIYSTSREPSGEQFDGYCFGFAQPEDMLRLLGQDSAAARTLEERISPYALPVVVSEQDEHVRAFAQAGMRTVCRLPLRSPTARKRATEQIREILTSAAPVLLFLDRVGTLQLEILGADPLHESLVRRVAELPGPEGIGLTAVDLGSRGQFLLATRQVPHENFIDAIRASIEAQLIDPEWLSWKQEVVVSVAARIDAELDAGRLYCFLPMGAQATAPAAVHVNAPFAVRLARDGLVEGVPLNDMLFSAIADCCVVVGLHLCQDAKAKGLITDLLAWSSDHLPTLRAAFDRLDMKLERAPFVPVLGSPTWASLQDSFHWDDSEATVLTSSRIAQATKRPILDPSIGDRRVQRICALRREVMGVPMEPRLEVIPDWIEVVAASMRKGQTGPTGTFDPGIWLAFYDELDRLFGQRGSLLAGRRILIDDDLVLRPCWGGNVEQGKTNAAVFFQARSDDGDEDAEVAIDHSIPASLRKHIAYMHSGLDWHVPGSQGRPENRVGRRFLESQGLVRPFRKQGVFERVRDVLTQSTSKRVRADALRLVFNLDANGRYNQKPGVVDLGLRVPALGGSWIVATQARFSEAWSGTEGLRLARLISQSAGVSSELASLANKMLLPPNEWGFRVDPLQWVPFLKRIGVKDGLWPVASPAVGDSQGYLWNPTAFSRWAGLNEQDQKSWIPAATLADHQGWHPYTPYRSDRIVRIPGQSDFEALDRPSRELFGSLVGAGLSSWPSSMESFAIRRPNHPGSPDERRWPAPAWTFLANAKWVQVSRPGEAGATDLAAPRDVWRYQDEGEPQPLFAPLLSGDLRNRVSEDVKLRLRLADLGVRNWSDPAVAGRRLILLTDLLEAGEVSEGHLASFRKAYERSWGQLVTGKANAPWATEAEVRLVVGRHGRLGLYRGGSSDERLYVLGEPDRLSETLLGSLDDPLLRVDPEHGNAAAQILAPLLGDQIRVVRSGDFRVFVDGTEVIGARELPLMVAPGREWFVDLVALTLELKASQFNRQSAQTVRTAIEKLRRLRLQSGHQLRIELDGEHVPIPVFLSQAMPVPDDENPTIAFVEPDEVLGWQTLGQVAQSTAELIGQSWAGSHLQLAIEKLARRGGNDEPFAPNEEDYSAAFNDSPERIREIRRELRGVSDDLLYWLRPVAHYLTGIDLLQIGKLSGNEGEIEDLVRQLADLPEGYGADRLILAGHDARSLAELRDSLCLDFRLFNQSLASLGRPYHAIHNEEGQASAFLAHLSAGRSSVLDALRAQHLAAFDASADLPDFAAAVGELTRVLMRRPSAASGVPELGPDPSWIDAFDVPPDEVMDARVETWLRSLGADPRATVDLPPYDDICAANRAVIATLAGQARPIVAAWVGKHSEIAPPDWARPYQPADLVERFAAAGRLGFRILSPDQLMAELARWGEWPSGMPLSLALSDLGVSAEDLTKQDTAAERIRWLRDQERRSVLLDGHRVSLDGPDVEELLKLVRGGISEAFLATAATLTDLGQVGSAIRKQSSGTRNHSAFRAGRLPEAKAETIGFIGELIAYEWIKAHYTSVGPECWVSANRRFVYPDDHGDDRLGYDFKIPRRRRKPLYLEVKSSSDADALSFELKESEIRAAQDFAGTGTYRIVFIVDVLDSATRSIHLLPNPLDPTSQGHYRVVGTGIRYAFKLEES